jgi:predicted glutamine amidotransferase
MCQLLGMNCNVLTDICFSFEGFSARGGVTDYHSDGWGIAFFEGKGCRLFIDAKSTLESPVAELVKRYPIRSMNVIAHIRKATQGMVALEAMSDRSCLRQAEIGHEQPVSAAV